MASTAGEGMAVHNFNYLQHLLYAGSWERVEREEEERGGERGEGGGEGGEKRGGERRREEGRLSGEGFMNANSLYTCTHVP